MQATWVEYIPHKGLDWNMSCMSALSAAAGIGRNRINNWAETERDELGLTLIQ